MAAIIYSPQLISFTSLGNPPNNIAGFNIERSVDLPLGQST
jgi:hypothetical protein